MARKGSRAFSAGSHPSAYVHPLSLATLKSHGINTEGYRSKSWNEFADQPMDAVITVCDNAAGEVCPVFFGAPVKAHWGVADPAHFQGTEAEIGVEFERIFSILALRVEAMVNLPENLDKPALATKLNEIGKL